MKRSTLWLGALALAAVGCSGNSGSGVASGTKGISGTLDTGKEVLLRLKLQPGQTYTTYMVSESSGGGQTIKFTITQEQKVDKIENGNYSISSTLKDMKVEGSGQQIEAMRKGAESQKGKVTTLVLSDRGKIVSSGDPTGNDMNLPALPEQPIKAGTTWEGDFEAMMVKGKMVNRAEGVQTVSGKQAMKVVTTLSNADGTLSGTTNAWFDIETGQTILVESSAKVKLMGQEVASKTRMELR
ncbi:MAG: hypothetical protein WAO58_05620 [Fimbriimonadaceae bacterium]